MGETGPTAPCLNSLAIQDGYGHLDVAGHLEVLNWVIQAKSLSLCRVTWSWVLGISGHLWGSEISCPPH